MFLHFGVSSAYCIPELGEVSGAQIQANSTQGPSVQSLERYHGEYSRWKLVCGSGGCLKKKTKNNSFYHHEDERNTLKHTALWKHTKYHLLLSWSLGILISDVCPSNMTSGYHFKCQMLDSGSLWRTRGFWSYLKECLPLPVLIPWESLAGIHHEVCGVCMSAGFGHPCPSDPRAKAGADLQNHAHNPRVRKPVSFTCVPPAGEQNRNSVHIYWVESNVILGGREGSIQIKLSQSQISQLKHKSFIFPAR